MRILLIPADYKNYLIASLDIGFWEYFIPGFIHAYFYFSLYFILGVNFTSFKDIINGNYPKDDKVRYWIFVSSIILFTLLNVAIFIGLIVFTVKKYK